MDNRIFLPEPMGLQQDLLAMGLEDRFSYNPAENLFCINFEGLNLDGEEMIEDIRTAVEARIAPLGRKVYAIVNYDNFTIAPRLIEPYTDMVRYLTDRYYTGVTRYTTSTFLRMKLGQALERRSLAPHIYESSTEARNVLLDT